MLASNEQIRFNSSIDFRLHIPKQINFSFAHP